MTRVEPGRTGPWGKGGPELCQADQDQRGARPWDSEDQSGTRQNRTREEQRGPKEKETAALGDVYTRESQRHRAEKQHRGTITEEAVL